MADKKQNGPIVIRFLKRAEEKQSESLSQLCTIIVYGEGVASLSKPHQYSFRAAAHEKWVTFWGKFFFFLLEINT